MKGTDGYQTVRRVALAVLTAALILPAPAPGQGQPLSLAEALARADARAFANRAARAGEAGASAQAMATWRGILPTLRVEAGFMRTTDPVGAFGTTLRQQRITMQDFDPARLNFPGPRNNHAGALVLEQPLVVTDAWLAARAGRRAATSAERGAHWTALSTRADVVRAWFGTVLAAERVATLDSAARAAHAHVRQAEDMLEAGLVTKSDVLLAEVRAGDLDVSLVEAQGDAALARRQLAMVLGDAALDDRDVPASLPDDSASERLANDVLAMSPATRADIEAASAGVAAAGADVARARAAMLPRLVSFARRDLNSDARPFGGASNWTVGVMASWTPFSGGSEIAGQRAAAAQRDQAQAQLDGALAQAAIDLERSELALRTALARLAIARQAVRLSAEAHRIVSRKYEGGLATIVELLDASATDTQARLSLSAARHALLSATAGRLHAIGADPARMAVLDPAGR